jgi:N-acetylmuramic acid 6-phosphate etherase
VIEAAECPPTFNTPRNLVQAVMAGGRQALFQSQEGAEDNISKARHEVRKKIRKGDVVVGISASGVTPFVRGALKEAKRCGARTILVACNLRSPLRSVADILIAPQTGAEIISGSTRLKAGTATKLILNRLTVASMVQLGKVYKNWMVDLQPRSRKLEARALHIMKRVTGVSNQKARLLLKKAKGEVKIAILISKKNFSYREACRALNESSGFLRKALR